MPIYTLPFISGLLLFLASPAPNMVALAWISMIPLFIFLQTVKTRQAFFTGWLAGTLYYLCMLYWVTISMETYGGLAPWLSISGLISLSLYMGIYHAIFCGIMARHQTGNQPFPLVFTASLWVGLDYLRGILFTGLPWMDVGYFHYLSPIRQLADIGGHHGVTFLILMVNGLLYKIVQNRSVKLTLQQTWIALILIVLAFGYPSVRLMQVKGYMDQAQRLQTGVIQGNINQAVKWQTENKLASVNTHIKLTNSALEQDSPPKLILWPETSLPFYPTLDPIFYHVQAETILQKDMDYELLCGAPHIIRKEKGYELYNAALILRPDKSFDFYFKQHLVPFGEYIPLRNIFPFPKAIVDSIGDFSAGTKPNLLETAKARVGVLICIEAIYPDLARKQVKAGATLLANITNDAWFGRSSAPIQHLAMAVFRAVENRRSLARSANTGISALISPTGEILSASDLFTTAALVAPLPLLEQRSLFNRFGFLFPLCCLTYTVIVVIRRRTSKAIDA